MVQQSLTIGAVNILNIFNLAHSLEAMLQSKPDLFAKTQIRIVSLFLSDGFQQESECTIHMEIQVCPTRSPGAKPSGLGTPSDLGLAVTAHRWPGVGRMPGVPSAGPMPFIAFTQVW